jgi:hypothetical protein
MVSLMQGREGFLPWPWEHLKAVVSIELVIIQRRRQARHHAIFSAGCKLRQLLLLGEKTWRDMRAVGRADVRWRGFRKRELANAHANLIIHSWILLSA